MAAANQILKIANKQIGYTEDPPGSNKTKYGRKFGLDGVQWCAIFLWWCGNRAKEKFGGSNPIPHNANAAYIQDDIVKKGGKWVLKKTTSLQARKQALKKIRPGDVVCFDFGRMDAYRRHVGIVERVSGNYVYTIEGNTSSDDKGNQSNGGGVFGKKRKYNLICSAARPAYK